MELNHPRKSARRSVHLQLYTYSDFIAGAVRQSLGPLKMFSRQILERLVIAQGYLHSDDSPAIEMKLQRDGQKDLLQLEPQRNPETAGTIKRVLREVSCLNNGARWAESWCRPCCKSPGRGAVFIAAVLFPCVRSREILKAIVWAVLLAGTVCMWWTRACFPLSRPRPLPFP